MDRMDVLAVFVAVAEEGSFVRAARRLGRSPAAVTRAVAALEERIGTRLLNRTTRAVALTDSGMRYLEGARRVLDEMAVIFRDAMAGDSSLFVNADIPTDIERVGAAWSREKLPRAIDAVLETRTQVFHANANIDGALADLFLKLKRLN